MDQCDTVLLRYLAAYDETEMLILRRRVFARSHGEFSGTAGGHRVGPGALQEKVRNVPALNYGG